jgi:two-component system, chemotaxis family, chemotaxis protein CheY
LPDVIFLDINMQFMDGWTFLEEYEHIVGKMQKQIVIFMVSSSMDPEEIQRAKQNPLLSEYVIKPVTKIQFDDIIAKAKKEIETIQLSA